MSCPLAKCYGRPSSDPATTRIFAIPRQTRIVLLCKREQTISAQGMPFYPTDNWSRPVDPQVRQTATSSWRNLSTAHLALPFYPFMHVAPNGKVFCAGPSQTTRYLDATGTGAWSLVGSSNFGTRKWGSTVMYDEGKVLLMGGSPCAPYPFTPGATSCTTYPTATAEIIDLNNPNPAWTYTGSMVTGGR